ncbi:aminodeoxychorismate/anthranilate synthase component II [Oceanospirillaceae bacterium]|jgi:anthranilate synthase component 2|nr:aminodeoxychorismate/anthranilate synthase component II [Oceanospirillaceae bacterium]MBT4998958.1 aminodeoxychorismate/anthranilate synthase component II [Oceanospirillaceae bacterium]MBT5629865.1 aminodeoxychorismate/anthranilate synthase component II [Oceanospirillaceae bacterium]MBT6101794.1 aminodeoxychorismate/anthranilate synthase component II [Oceanospirillaceae bacterium]MBT7672845.1 aminodeoxychorismate/anthranilate synthase component II [Oceanospirillaceae bacterium]
MRQDTPKFTVYLVDNYDSFTYNLYQYIGEVLTTAQLNNQIGDFEVIVARNDQVTVADIEAAHADRIIISPGPGSPEDESYFGVCAQVITELGPKIPLLGVCLGMQGIVHCFGGKVVKAYVPMHGKVSPISHDGMGIFKDIPDQLEVMRYHSLMAAAESMPDCLTLTAVVGDLGSDSYEIMAVKHKQFPIQGIQFHPESFATEGGKELMKNFLLAS